MRKAVRVICLMIALVLVTLGISTPVYSDPPNEVTIKLKKAGSSCSIFLSDKGNRFKGVCKHNTHPRKCSVTGFTWKVMNETGNDACPLTSFTLVIKNAPGHLNCFPDAHPDPWFVAKFDAYGQVRISGPPSPECSQDKFGTYWPYVISLYGTDTSTGVWGLLDTTDPGAIIFP
jgi:hypothetical protein